MTIASCRECRRAFTQSGYGAQSDDERYCRDCRALQVAFGRGPRPERLTDQVAAS